MKKFIFRANLWPRILLQTDYRTGEGTGVSPPPALFTWLNAAWRLAGLTDKNKTFNASYPVSIDRTVLAMAVYHWIRHAIKEGILKRFHRREYNWQREKKKRKEDLAKGKISEHAVGAYEGLKA